MSFDKSTVIEGTYEILETFDGGGMGIVYRARHLLWNIDVAIKHPRRKILMSRKQLDEFHAECEIWATLGLHPYIITCYYSREIESLPCVIAEYLPRGSLQKSIECRDLYRRDEIECQSNMLSVAASTAWGLFRAHQSGMLHCDVKPGNMLLTSFGTAKIGDFGLSLLLRPSIPNAKAIGFTAAYSSPEQLKGQSLTPSADVWSWAASMLAMYVGEVSWENGAACGAALRQYLENGGKAYRIPPMPKPLADLLLDCFQFSPDKRISDFRLIAESICKIHDELLGEPCPATKPDLELLSADSLNNRAVSRYDRHDLSEVYRLLDEALTIDPLHPESNFNAALLNFSTSDNCANTFLERLEQVAQFEPGNYRHRLYRACLLNLYGKRQEATSCLNGASRIGGAEAAEEIQRLWDMSIGKQCVPVLSPPISGEDFAHDSERFERLMNKAEHAVQSNNMADAKRYILMSGDIQAFARHPRRRRLLTKLYS